MSESTRLFSPTTPLMASSVLLPLDDLMDARLASRWYESRVLSVVTGPAGEGAPRASEPRIDRFDGMRWMANSLCWLGISEQNIFSEN